MTLRLMILAAAPIVLFSFESKAGPVCRQPTSFGESLPANSFGYQTPAIRSGIHLDIIYSLRAQIQACEYGSGRQVTCALYTTQLTVERLLLIRREDGKGYTIGGFRVRWEIPNQLGKGGFAKGHDCNDLLPGPFAEREDAKWAKELAQMVPNWKPLIDADRDNLGLIIASIDSNASRYMNDLLIPPTSQAAH